MVLFLFADESGDILFRKGKRYFVYVGILVKSRKECEKRLSELKLAYSNTFKRRFTKPEVKGAKLEQDEIIYFLNGLKTLDYGIFYAYVDTYDSKKEFNKICDGNLKKAQLLETIISNIYSTNHAINRIIVDKGLPQDVLEKLRERLSKKFKEVPKIESEASHKIAGIQLADLIAWALSRHLTKDSIYFSYISDKIKTKTEL